MGTFKKTKLVMLPTNEKSNIVMNNIQQGLFVVGGDGILAKHRMGDCTNQHLYFLSDEEIKEGDWIYDEDNGVVKIEHKYQLSNINVFRKDCKKIIATTDSNLTIKTLLFVQGENKEIDVLLPQPSQSFIEKFVEEYNHGNVITEVMVEYEVDDGYMEVKSYLKINPKDNTITIRKVKDSWNRDEVEEKIRKGAYVFLNGSIGDFDKWIEENL